jgi:hypothetical protein
MKRFALILFAMLGITAFAADTAVQGYLMDANCSPRKAQRPGAAVAHTRGCLRMPFCENSGYGVLTENKHFVRFDKDGNEKAAKFLADIDKTDTIKVTVSGTVDGDKMTVTKIELQ